MGPIKVSLRDSNAPKTLIVWAINVEVFSGVVMAVLNVRDVEDQPTFLTKYAERRINSPIHVDISRIRWISSWSMVQPTLKCCFPRCRELREAAGLSMTKLAAAADVSRDLVRSLENGNPHSRHKVMMVFNTLQKLHHGALCGADELTPHSGAEDTRD